MDQQEQQLIDRIKQAQNVLVTVSSSPSVDQLAAAIGLTVALNKLDKHGTAVFSGQVPSTIEFLKPEDTLEKNTDSLRDFIIALDKSKADKLRYKVEDQVVRIFITPYRTSLSQNDLEFSQGDFNVDVVVALGVAEQKELDQAITSHGRILHDATVATVSTAGEKSELGTINWVDQGASSLSEMMLSLVDGLDKSLLDGQIATALLTGIVATTDRFRNEKTTPETMSVSAELMAAGANQQLIATKLEGAPLVANASAGHIHAEEGEAAGGKPEPGTLAINHQEMPMSAAPLPGGGDMASQGEADQIHVDDDGTFGPAANPMPPMPPGPGMMPPPPQISDVHAVEEGGAAAPSGLEHHDQITLPPAYGGSNPSIKPYPEESEPSTEELTLPSMNAPLLSHNQTVLGSSPPAAPPSNDNPFIPQAPLPPQMAQEYTPPPIQPASPEPFAPVVPPSVQPTPPAPMAPPITPAPALTMLPAPSAPTPAPPAPFTIPTAPMPGPIVPMGASPALSSPPPVAPIQPTFPTPPSPPTPPAPLAPVAPPISPASASLIPGETLEELEQTVHSPHLQQPAGGSPAVPASAPALSESSLDDARSAVRAALNSNSGPSSEPLRPIAALNAQPLGPELHPAPLPPPVGNPGFNEPTPGDTPADATLDMPLPSNPFGPAQPMGPPPMPPGGLPPAPSGGPGTPPPVPPPFFPQQ
ncbi:MAG TPA: hypothetical protein VGM08_04790 [Candidatus Saccharimonadales bacterium]|jgi:hypothetical protein